MARRAQAAREELLGLADSLAEVMCGHHGRSAMVRVFVDDEGEVVAACNLYADSGSMRSLSASTPVAEFREVL